MRCDWFKKLAPRSQLGLVTTAADNQSKREKNTCNRRKARENAGEQVTTPQVWFYLTLARVISFVIVLPPAVLYRILKHQFIF